MKKRKFEKNKKVPESKTFYLDSAFSLQHLKELIQSWIDEGWENGEILDKYDCSLVDPCGICLLRFREETDEEFNRRVEFALKSDREIRERRERDERNTYERLKKKFEKPSK
jgi:hypothetical protein